MWHNYSSYNLDANTAEDILKIIRKGMADSMYPDEILETVRKKFENSKESHENAVKYARNVLRSL